MLLISVPHAGTFVPPAVAARLTAAARALPDTDWFVDRLCDGARPADATVLVATHSRYVIDLNRGPDGAALYPGQAETGLLPRETFDGRPLWNAAPTVDEVAARVAAYWQPYHDALAAELARVRDRHGRAHLLDLHSIRSVVPRLFPGVLPALNFGTNSGHACPPALLHRAIGAAGDMFDHVTDQRFRGGFITRHYGVPAWGVAALQLEIAQRTYMDEDGPPAWDAGRAAALIAVVQRVAGALAA